MRRVAVASTLSILLGVVLVVWREIRGITQAVADAINGKPA